MSEELTAAQARAARAEERARAAEADRDAAVAKAADADARPPPEAERDAAIARPGRRRATSARPKPSGTPPGRRQQRRGRRPAGPAGRPRQAAAEAAQAETGRVRADAEQALGQARADAAREREELRADLRARAERAEQQADTYRAELDRLRAASPDADRPRRPPRRRGAARAPRPPSPGRRRGNERSSERRRADEPVPGTRAGALAGLPAKGLPADTRTRADRVFRPLGEGIEAAIGWRTTQAMGCQSSYSYARQRDWLRFWRLIYLPVAK